MGRYVFVVLSISWIQILTILKGIMTQQLVQDISRYTDFVIVADSVDKSLYQISTDGSIYRKVLSSPDPPLAVDYDPARSQVYWSTFIAGVNGTIHRASISGGAKETLVYRVTPFQPRCIAVDSTAELLFFSDDGKGTIQVMSLRDRNNFKTIILNTRSPSSIKLDPQQRHIYWTDSNIVTHRVERANYDGTGRVTLVTQDGMLIESVALDFPRSQMFWTDAMHSVIYRAGLDGSEVREVFRYSPAPGQLQSSASEHMPHYYSLAVDDYSLYFTDFYNNSVLKVDKGGSTLQQLGPKIFNLAQGLKLYSSSYTIIGKTSNCDNSNGDCSDLCLPTTTSRVCACPDDRRLEANGLTCSQDIHANGPDVIWSEYDGNFQSYIRGIKGEPRHFLATAEVRTWTINNPAWSWTALASDYHRSMLYLIDQADRFLVQLNLNGTKDIKPILYGMSSDCRGLAVDWLTGNLYWTDAIYNWISIAPAVKGTENIKTLLRKLDEPHGIAVSPENGIMVWTDWGREPRIEKASLAGENRLSLVEYDVNRPTGIVIDQKSQRIFWVDTNRVESMNMDGSGRQVIQDYSANPTNFYAIAIHEGILMMTDQGGPGANPMIRFSNLSDSNAADVKLGLQRVPYGITMYHADLQPKIPSACETMGCTQLCVSAGGGRGQCLCRDGYSLNADTRSCSETPHYSEKRYVYSVGDRLCMVSLQDATSRLITSPSVCFFQTPDSKYEFRAMDFNFNQGDVYFSEVKFKVKSIRRASLRDRTDNQQVIFGTGDVEGIAIDWNANNLYWTDSTYGQINVARLDGSYPKTLYRTMGMPRAIALNPITRFVFWVEQQGGRSEIWWSRMDLSNPAVFLGSNLAEVTGLAFDFDKNSLVFVDRGRKTIEYVTVDSSRTRSVQYIANPNGLNPYDVALFQDYMVITNKNTGDSSGMRVIERKTGKELTAGVVSSGNNIQPRDIIAYDEHNQPFVQEAPQYSCSFNNGNCEQLCLPVTTVIRCDCIAGMKLINKTHCVPESFSSDQFLLIADDYRHSIYQSNLEFNKQVALKIPALDRPIGMTYDPVDDMIYWTDFNSKSIRREFLNGTALQTIHWYRNDSETRVDGIAFEPKSRALYFTDLGRHLVGVMNPQTNYQKVLIKDNIQKPRGIVLDPDNGQMYIGSNGTIERANMDGTNRVKIVSSDLGWPSGIAVDFQEGQIYWCDHAKERIEVANLQDGGNRRVLVNLHADADPFGIVLVGGYVYWSDWSIRGVFRISKDGRSGSPEVMKADFYTGLNDIVYVDRSKVYKPNACSENNGGCSHFCIPVPGGKRVCACPDDVGLASNTPADGLNCQTTGCPLAVSNGEFEERCTASVGSTCHVKCHTGFTAVTTIPLECLPGNSWSISQHTICRETTCELLPTPEDATVNNECPIIPIAGTVCYHNCKQGYARYSGDMKRECKALTVNNFKLAWSGQPLVCKKRQVDALCLSLPNPSHALSLPWHCATSDQQPGDTCKHVCEVSYVAISGDSKRHCQQDGTWSGKPLVCQPDDGYYNGEAIPAANKNEEKKMLIGLVVGIVGGVLLLVTVIAIIVCIVTRRKRDKTATSGANMRDSSNMVSPPGGMMPPALSYDVATDSINLAFDNPGYATHKELDIQPAGGAVGPPTPARDPVYNNDANVKLHKLHSHAFYGGSEKEGFENPAYETLGAAGAASKEGEYETLPVDENFPKKEKF